MKLLSFCSFHKTYMVRSGRDLNTDLLCSLCRESGCITLLAHWCVHQPGISTELWCPEFLLGSDYIGRIDWTIGHTIELNLQPHSPPWRLGWYQVAQPLNHMAFLPPSWLISLAWLIDAPPHQEHLINVNHQRPPWTPMTLLSPGKFQELRAYMPGNQVKRQTNSLLYNRPPWSLSMGSL